MRSTLKTLFNKSPVPLSATQAQGILPSWSTRSDAVGQMQTISTVSTLFAIVHRLSTDTAAVNWHLYRTHDGRGRIAGHEDENPREVTSHLALDVLDKPNPYMSRQNLFEISQQHEDLTGEWWWVVGRNGLSDFTAPLELWPIRPDRMEPVPSPTEFIAGYIYHSPSGEKVPLKYEDVICDKLPNPLDPYRGLGPVQSLLTDLDAARYSAEWNRNFFVNSAEPGGIVRLTRRMSDPEFKRFRDRWQEQHQGVAQSHRVAVLEEGEWIDRKFSQRDMQFSELRNISRDIIREAFSFPQHMLGLGETVNRATAEAEEYVYAKYQLGSRLERFKSILNTRFLPMFGTTGQGVYFDYDNPIPENLEAINADRDSRVNAAKSLVEAGFEPEDVLEAMGLPQMGFTKPFAPAMIPPSQDINDSPDPSKANDVEGEEY